MDGDNFVLTARQSILYRNDLGIDSLQISCNLNNTYSILFNHIKDEGCANTNTICILENYMPEQLRISVYVRLRATMYYHVLLCITVYIRYSDNISKRS